MLTAWLIIDAGLLVAVTIFAIQAIRARRLIVSTLWLASGSAVIAIIFYALGACQAAVFGLSVGTGLVAVLFVLAISIAGEDALRTSSRLPQPLAWVLTGGAVLLLCLFAPTIDADLPTSAEPAFSSVMWQQRGLNALVQLVLIFAGVVGLLGLLAEDKAAIAPSVASQVRQNATGSCSRCSRE